MDILQTEDERLSDSQSVDKLSYTLDALKLTY